MEVSKNFHIFFDDLDLDEFGHEVNVIIKSEKWSRNIQAKNIQFHGIQ